MSLLLKTRARELYLASAVTLALSLAAGRRLLAQHSIVFFAWYYLGIRLPLHQEFWARVFLRSPRLMLLAPRNHGKTVLLSKIIPLWLICFNRAVRILLVTQAADLAEKNAMAIRNELDGNKRMIADFGVFRDRQENNMWRQRQFTVLRESSEKDPTIDAIGLFGSITGGRFDYIILDDPIDEKLVTTEDIRAKVERYLTGTLLPLLTPDGCAWMIGTRKHFGDLYSLVMKNPLWRTITNRAIIGEPANWRIVKLEEPWVDAKGFEHFVKVEIDGDDHGKCLWPEERPIPWLLLRRHEWGSVMFNREMQQEVVDDATALFRLEWLNQCREQSLSYVTGQLPDAMRSQFELIMHGVDPSLVTEKKQAEKTDSDYMVQFAIGVTRDGTRTLLGIDRERGLSPSAVEHRIKAFHDRFKPYRTSIEANAFGIIHAHNLVTNTGIPVMKHTTGRNKSDPFEGVGHLSPLFENRKFRLPYQTEEDRRLTDALIAELHAFPFDVHDDQVMALWITDFAILRWLAAQARRRRVENRPAGRSIGTHHGER